MPYCMILQCKNNSSKKNIAHGGISYHRFPKDPVQKGKWIDATGRQEWMPNKLSTICSSHFCKDDFLISGKGNRYIKDKVIPTQNIFAFMKSNEVGLPPQEPSPDQYRDDSNSSLEVPAQDLKKKALLQCRFCGEFSKNCLDIDAGRPYVQENRTSLTINGLSIDLSFNDATLPKTVCTNCDDKMQGIADFVKIVSAAQNSLINVAEEIDSVVKVEDLDTEDNDNEDNDDELELCEVLTHKNRGHEPASKRKRVADQQKETNEDTANAQDKTISNTSQNAVLTYDRSKSVFRKYTGSVKRKVTKKAVLLQNNSIVRNEMNTQGKRGGSNGTEDTELIMNIKEEIEDSEESRATHEESHVNDASIVYKPHEEEFDSKTYNVTEDTALETDIKEEMIDIEESQINHADYKPDEAELASNALLYEMSKS